MSVETPRHGLQLEVSRARLVQFAERLVFPDHSGRGHADGGFVLAGLVSSRRMAGAVAVRDHIPFDGCDSCHARLHSGKGTGHARVANFTNATDLSADV